MVQPIDPADLSMFFSAPVSPESRTDRPFNRYYACTGRRHTSPVRVKNPFLTHASHLFADLSSTALFCPLIRRQYAVDAGKCLLEQFLFRMPFALFQVANQRVFTNVHQRQSDQCVGGIAAATVEVVAVLH